MHLIALLFVLFFTSISLASHIHDEKSVTSSPSSNSTSSANQTPRLVVYVQTFTDTMGKPLSLLPLLEEKTGVTHVIIGSLHLHEEPGKIMLNNDPLNSPIYDSIWEEVKILQRGGIKVMALLGGAAGGTYQRLKGGDDTFNSYYQPLLTLLRKYSFDGLDIDIEEPVPITVPLRLLKSLRSDLGPDFILTLAPFCSALADEEDEANLSGFSYLELENLAEIPDPSSSTGEKTSLIAWYNTQFYGGYAKGVYLYKRIIEQRGFDPRKVVLGVVTSKEGHASSFVKMKKLVTVIEDLKGLYPDFGGVAGWEYWDAGSSDKEFGGDGGGNDGKPWRWVKRVGEALFTDTEGDRIKTEL
ncbi:glycoside hydrolase family 18 protein [Xylogone sp. PMI_703]|nr:glycoside hydrolase family 18 protein [Xylogone sp. PMI_703]